MADLSPFESFQLEEYKNISNSHYESVKQISTFFRYYLLILAAPAFILNIVTGKNNDITIFLQGNASPVYYNLVFYYFLVVAIVGFLIYLYIINLRLDAVLYARAVNKVRKFFYQSSNLNIMEYEQYLQLPIVATQPKYTEKTFFVPLLFVFSIIDCGLLLTGLSLKILNSIYFGTWFLNFNLPISKGLILIIVILFFLLHLIGYLYLAELRTNYYLKSYSIGIDIDGVVNDQTSHFANWLKNLTGKDLDLNLLKEIPVSINPNIGVSDLDEKIIFNTKEYWETLPIKNDAARRINEFQKRFGLKIFFFSYRDWPQFGSQEALIKQTITSKNLTPLKKGDIAVLTAKWLKTAEINSIIVHGFLSSVVFRIQSIFKSNKRAVIEMGNQYISDTRYWNHFRRAILNRNRFQGASIKGFKFFIEDTPENAIKLSNLCEYVFMFDEPYNRDTSKYNFPKNVIRVYTWNEIYSYLKSLS